MAQPVDRHHRAAVAPWVFSVICLVTGVTALVLGARASAAILLAGVLLHLVVAVSRRARWQPKADRPAH